MQSKSNLMNENKFIGDPPVPPSNPDPPNVIPSDPSSTTASKKKCMYGASFGILMIVIITSVMIVTLRDQSERETSLPILSTIPSNLPTIYPLSTPSLIPSNLPTIYPLSTPSTIPSNLPTVTPIQKLIAPDGAGGDYFGYSVAISGGSIVIGAWGDGDNGISSGSAYIFTTSGEYVNKITAPDGAAQDWFGTSVAISEDSIVIGAWRDDDNGTNSGSAYIYANKL